MTLTSLLVLTAGLAGPVKAGSSVGAGIVLQFDDGWSSWCERVAPLLARVDGRATGFVNNQHIKSGRIRLDDLLTLQNNYGWEIGSHAYTHVNAVRYVKQYGLERWLEDQLGRSLTELRAEGLRVTDFVFPFNAYTPEISQAVLNSGIGSYRRADPLALASGCRPDGSLPGTSIDLTRYLPLEVLKQWVDWAAERKQLLFLYGHRVEPDEAFVVGRIAEVRPHELVAEADLVLPGGEDVVLVPDMARRSSQGSVGGLVLADGRRIRTADTGPDLTLMTTPGATFLIGPAYGTRQSDFVGLIEYAAKRVPFYTVSDVVAGQPRPRAGGAGP